MKHFEVTVEDGTPGGLTRYAKGENRHLGFPLGPQEASTLSMEGGFVVIGFSKGAKVRIPVGRVIEIVEG